MTAIAWVWGWMDTKDGRVVMAATVVKADPAMMHDVTIKSWDGTIYASSSNFGHRSIIDLGKAGAFHLEGAIEVYHSAHDRRAVAGTFVMDADVADVASGVVPGKVSVTIDYTDDFGKPVSVSFAGKSLVGSTYEGK